MNHKSTQSKGRGKSFIAVQGDVSLVASFSLFLCTTTAEQLPQIKAIRAFGNGQIDRNKAPSKRHSTRTVHSGATHEVEESLRENDKDDQVSDE